MTQQYSTQLKTEYNPGLLYGGVGIFFTVIIILWWIFHEALAAWHLTHDPIHAAVEIVGSLAAFLVAFVLLQRNEQQVDFLMVAVGFISMGILDGLHAITYPGVVFVFLHSFASLMGGFFFALVWLPQNIIPQREWIVRGSILFSLVIGGTCLAFPELLPVMVTADEFTYGAVAINFAAGVLFLISVPYFINRFNETHNLEYFMFLCLALLFAFAELTFQFSKLWDGGWWLWHMFRLGAYLLTLWFVASWYLKTAAEVRHSRDLLEQTVEERTQELEKRQKVLHAQVANYSEFMSKVIQGNLSARLQLQQNEHQEDTPLLILGENLNNLIVQLHQMINQIREATVNISSAAAEISAAANQQASGANQQSAAINQTTATINEVKAIVEQAFEKAQAVAQKAKQTTTISENGSQAVTETVSGMRQIKEKVAGIAENILALSEQTQQIGEITTTVNEIASQSNLLALNASVEAARAGEHGKGFAVVAVEVRNLAEQSRQATSQVKTILHEIQQATNAAVMATEEGTKGVDSGMKMTQQAGDTISQLAQSITDNVRMAEQIVASVQQQNTGMEQIALAMQNINEATVQNLSATRQTERSAQDLTTLSKELEQLVGQYQLN